jgi:hypothetical protein
VAYRIDPFHQLYPLETVGSVDIGRSKDVLTWVKIAQGDRRWLTAAFVAEGE